MLHIINKYNTLLLPSNSSSEKPLMNSSCNSCFRNSVSVTDQQASSFSPQPLPHSCSLPFAYCSLPKIGQKYKFWFKSSRLRFLIYINIFWNNFHNNISLTKGDQQNNYQLKPYGTCQLDRWPFSYWCDCVYKLTSLSNKICYCHSGFIVKPLDTSCKPVLPYSLTHPSF